ncbi:hypothetical protein, partial [Caballeronia calidae]|uniref:hypothetical protein n=1 Tax=Caballeronia calidae TaxID=1777139 RepID=UPI001E296C88
SMLATRQLRGRNDDTALFKWRDGRSRVHGGAYGEAESKDFLSVLELRRTSPYSAFASTNSGLAAQHAAPRPDSRQRAVHSDVSHQRQYVRMRDGKTASNLVL